MRANAPRPLTHPSGMSREGLAVNATHDEWRPISGFDGYEVSRHGRVRSLHRVIMRRNGSPKTINERILASFTVPPVGYRYVHLWSKNRRTSRGIHVLVLEAFVGPHPDCMDACHNDGDPTNNDMSNLRWDTHAENGRDIVRHGRHREANKTHCKRGHALSGANLYINPTSGGRVCRQCNRDSRIRRLAAPALAA